MSLSRHSEMVTRLAAQDHRRGPVNDAGPNMNEISQRLLIGCPPKVAAAIKMTLNRGNGSSCSC